MSGYLLLISVGPVQEFIAQARRTRDLWFGSHVLSEISKSAARAIASDDSATLIFPALDRGAAALQPRPDTRDHTGAPITSVANKILALVTQTPAEIAQRARAAARTRLIEWGKEALATNTALVDPAAIDAADEQLDRLLDIHALWIPCPLDDDDAYHAARTQLEAALAARKSLNAFSPWLRQRGGAFKSSLDGGRETVLRKRRAGSPWSRYRIGVREELDAVGLLKRTGGDPEQFVPIPTVGLAAWLERADQRAPDAMRDLRHICKTHRLTRVTRDAPWVKAFPYDAQVFLPERWVPHLTEYGLSEAQARALGHRHIQRPVLATRPEPYPYVACIVADGDHMGRTIERLSQQGWQRHREFSGQLARFARDARHIVERDHRGVLVYAGGDDVLGFVCVQDALSCARALQQAFARLIATALPERATPQPTLSVGLGIGHVLQSLGALLQLGRSAEKAAKHHGRNALAIVYEKHAGATRTWSCSWDDDPYEQLTRAVGMLADRVLSVKKIHEIAALVHLLPSADEHRASWRALIHAEASRILARTQLGTDQATALSPERVELAFDRAGTLRQQLEQWVHRALIAHELLRAARAVRED